MYLFRVLVLAFLAISVSNAGVYGIKLLNDNQPDYSNAKAFMNSITTLQGTMTNEQKAISMWKWVSNSRFQAGNTSNEWGDGERDMLSQMNNYGSMICSNISSMMYSLYELTGNYARLNNLVAHTTMDVWYDNAFHTLDASMHCIVYNGSGVIASRDQMGTTAIWMTGCPQRTSAYPNAAIYSGDMDTRTLTHLKDCYVSPGNYDSGNREGTAVQQFYMNLFPYQYYKKYKAPLDSTADYNLPGNLNGNFDKSTVVTNGVWELAPDLTKTDWTETALNVTNMAQGGGVNLHPAATGSDGSVVFNLNTYNAMISGDITADVVKGASDSAEILISKDAGKTYTSLCQMTAGAFTYHLTTEIRRKRCMLVKFRFNAATTATSVGLNSLKIRLVTQINYKTFFQLERGSNKVFVNMSPYERVELHPDCDPATYVNYIHSQNNMSAGTGFQRIRPTAAGAGYVAYKLDAPGDIKRVVMSGNFWRQNPAEPFRFYYSIDNGTSWVKFGGDARLGVGTYNSTWGNQGDHFGDTTIAASGVRSVLLKAEITRTTGPNAITELWCAADYQPASAFKPLEVTLCWTEIDAAGVKKTRSHTHTVSSYADWTAWGVNTGGVAMPRMQSVLLNLQGYNPNGTAVEGYSDGIDAGPGDYEQKVYYPRSNLLSTGCAVTSSAAPVWGTLDSLVDERVPFGESGYVGVGKLGWGAEFTGGAAATDVTLNLGSTKSVAGVSVFQGMCRFAADQPTHEYADSIQVLAGADLGSLTYQGTIFKGDLWKWPGDMLPPQQWSRISDTSWYHLNLDSYDFNLAFPSAVNAQYVQFKVYMPDAAKKVLIWELRAWGTMSKTNWPFDVFNHSNVNVSVKGNPLELAAFNVARGVNVEVGPNPFSSAVVVRALAGNGIKDLKVYDMQGKLVYSSSQAADQIIWNGKDNAGRAVANGNYILKVNTLKGQAMPKVNLVR